MKKIISLLLACVLAVSLFGCNDSNTPQEITVLSYADYIPKDIIKDFTEKTNITINYVSAEDNDAIEAMLSAPSADYDLVITSDYVIHNLVQKNMLQPIDYSKFENNKYVNKGFTGKYYDPDNKYTVPYCAAGILIGYDPYSAGIYVDSWADLLAPELKGKITFLNDRDGVVGVANMIMGKDPNYIEDTDSTFNILRALAKSAVPDSADEQYPEDALATGKAAVGVLFTSQLGYATAVNRNIEIVYPKEGFICSIDSMAIPSTCDNTDAAMQFINYVHDPVNNGKLTESLGLSSTNISGKQFMGDDYRDSKGYHIESNEAKNGVFFRQMSKENIETFENLFNKFRYNIPRSTEPQE